MTNTLGYELKFGYTTDGNSAPGSELNVVKGINLATEYCDPSLDACNVSASWPSVTVSGNGTSVTNPLGQTTTLPPFTVSATANLIRPGGPNLTIAFDASARVTSVFNGTGSWAYAYASDGTTMTTTVTDPNQHTRRVATTIASGTVASDTDALGHTTAYVYDGYQRLIDTTTPDGVKTHNIYDLEPTRGNVVETDTISSDGGTTIRQLSGYDTTCGNPLKCNLPNWTKDANGYQNASQTDYTYTAQGQLASTIGPASSSAGGLRSEQDLYYGPQYASYYTAPNTRTRQSAPVYRLTGSAACSTAQTCLHTSTSTETGLSYDPNNLQLTSFTKGQNGSPPLYLTNSTTYDAIGNVATTTDPLNNVTRYLYDADRELVGVIGPDADGAGPLRFPAIRYGYLNGRVNLVEQGTMPSQNASDWPGGFVSLAQAAFSYDGVGRKVRQDDKANGVSHSITQFDYDAANRLTCTAVRMNMAVAPPPTACQQGIQSTFGPDRLTVIGYDWADQPTSVTSGYLTPLQKVESTGYTNDGLVQTQTDAKGYRTTYLYDTLDRMDGIQYPLANTKGVSDSTDYEGYLLDANGNIVYDRRRDGANAIGYSYDNANRLYWRTESGSSTKIFGKYAYDNLGRVTGTANADNLYIGYSYDAVGRLLSEAGPLGTVSYQYDAGGRLTRLTWPDSYYVSYICFPSGAIKSIDDANGSVTGYDYDDLGRRLHIYRPYVANTTYAYDGNLRLAGLSHGFINSANNETWGFAYDPSGALRLSNSSNPRYDWAPTNTVSRGYAVDGQNRYFSSGGIGLGYGDGRGNVTNDTRLTYGYDLLNRLTSVSNAATLGYDAADRLFQTTGGATTRFLYAGEQIIGKYDGSGAVLRRYVPGPGTDEPVLWYEGAGYGDRRYLLADRQGSIVATATAQSGVTAVNTYDESGTPGIGDIGRFEYDGAPYIPEADLYHLRARDYSYRLGRFMQTDPIGYGDGLNFYNFAGGDPVNGVDPSGLCGAGGEVGVSTVANADGTTTFLAGSPPSIKSSCPSGVAGGGGGGNGGLSFSDPGPRERLGGRGPQNIQQISNPRLPSCSGAPGFDAFSRAADNAFRANPFSVRDLMFPFSTMRGIAIHTEFASSISALGSPYSAEISYRGGLVVPYGTSGSIRTDGVYGPVASPLYAVELKSGFSFPSPSEINSYYENLPSGTRLCGLAEGLAR